METKRKRCQCADCTNYSVLGYDYCVCCMDEDTNGRDCFCHCVGCVHAEVGDSIVSESGQQDQCALPAKVKHTCSHNPAAKVWKVNFANQLVEVITHDIHSDPTWLHNDLLYQYPYPNISDKEIDRESVPAMSWENRDFIKPVMTPTTFLSRRPLPLNEPLLWPLWS